MGKLHEALKHRIPEPTLMLIYAALIGVGAGYGAVVFRKLIELATYLGYGISQTELASYHGFRVFFVPAAGGLLVGLLIFFFAREAKGHGVPEVMFAITENKGILRPRVVIVKALASALSIGSGGSVGREGPIVQIGSAWGSTFGRFLGVQESHLKTLVACGAAGGIAATFNAPIGGVFFASEIILGSFVASDIGALGISSVLASTIGRAYFGNYASFAIPPYMVTGIPDLFAFIALGLAGGLFGVLYTRVLYLFEDFWDRLRVPEWVKPATGGVLIGVIGFFFPQVFGVGYPTVEAALFGRLGVGMLFALLGAKLVITSVTLGSGGSGGVFAPGLFMGAMLGGAFSVVANSLIPSLSVSGGALAMVGMAAVFASSAQAPITAIVMLFEMTGDYELVLPLMLATLVATATASLLERENIYSFKLTRRGVDIIRRRKADRLSAILVEEAMRPLAARVADTMKITDAIVVLDQAGERVAILETADGLVRGLVSRHQLLEELSRGRRAVRKLNRVAPLATYSVPATSPLSEASRVMSGENLNLLLVIDEEGDPVGTIDADDIVRAYGRSGV